jgi:hypothetical protein
MKDLMKHVAAMVLVGLMAYVETGAQSTAGTEKELLRLQNEWAAARVKGDVAFLETLYGKEFRITNTSGSVVERDADIACSVRDQ